MTTSMDGQTPSLGWPPTNPRMFTQQKEVSCLLTNKEIKKERPQSINSIIGSKQFENNISEMQRDYFSQYCTNKIMSIWKKQYSDQSRKRLSSFTKTDSLYYLSVSVSMYYFSIYSCASALYVLLLCNVCCLPSFNL